MIGLREQRWLKRLLKRFIPKPVWQFIRGKMPNKRGDPLVEEMLITQWYEAKRSANQEENNQPSGLPGVNLVGYFQASTGLGEAARGSASALERANIPFHLIDFEFNIADNQKVDKSYINEFQKDFKFNVNLLHVNPLEMPYLWETFDKRNLIGHYTIGFWYWELLDLPDPWVSRFKVVDEVWVASDFVKRGIEGKSPVPVIKIAPCVTVAYDSRLSRKDFQLPEDRFLFMCAYDVLSVHERKNPLAAIEAFKKAFAKKDSSVGLVIKVNNARENPEGMKNVRNQLSEYSNIFFVNETFTKEKFNSLLNLVDAYVSLHRSEGFGLIPAEAMFLGKPVIMTNWSGNTDFMTEDNSCGVNYQLVRVGEGNWPYQPDQLWADADTDHAASYMKRLFEDRVYYSRISKNATNYIHTSFSPEFVGRAMRNRLEQLKLL